MRGEELMMPELLNIYEYVNIYNFCDATTEYERLLSRRITQKIIKVDGDIKLGNEVERRVLYWLEHDWELLHADYKRRMMDNLEAAKVV